MPNHVHFNRRERCPGCGSADLRTLYRTPYSEPPLIDFLVSYYSRIGDARRWLKDADYVVEKCMSCSLSFQSYVPTGGFLNEIYDRWLSSCAEPMHQSLPLPPHCRDGQELLMIARTLGQPAERLRVLDYGMGWGSWARMALKLGCKSYGFEISEARTKFAAEHGVSTVTEADIPGLELDFVNTEQVIEHLTDPFACVQMLSSGLRAGGILKISVPQATSLERELQSPEWVAGPKYRFSLRAIHPLEHLNCFTPRALDMMARRAGLEPARLPLRTYYSFLAHIAPNDHRSAMQVGKGLLRPAYHRYSRRNLYRWYRKVAELDD